MYSAGYFVMRKGANNYTLGGELSTLARLAQGIEYLEQTYPYNEETIYDELTVQKSSKYKNPYYFINYPQAPEITLSLYFKNDIYIANPMIRIKKENNFLKFPIIAVPLILHEERGEFIYTQYMNREQITQTLQWITGDEYTITISNNATQITVHIDEAYEETLAIMWYFATTDTETLFELLSATLQ